MTISFLDIHETKLYIYMAALPTHDPPPLVLCIFTLSLTFKPGILEVFNFPVQTLANALPLIDRRVHLVRNTIPKMWWNCPVEEVRGRAKDCIQGGGTKREKYRKNSKIYFKREGSMDGVKKRKRICPRSQSISYNKKQVTIERCSSIKKFNLVILRSDWTI